VELTVRQTRRVHIPVRLVDGTWECAFGGAVPVNDGTEAELILERDSIADDAFLARMESKGLYKVLDEGASLLVALTIKPEYPPKDTLRPLLKYYADFPNAIATESLDDWNWNPKTLAFVEVRLAKPDPKHVRLFGSDRGGLWLRTIGIEPDGLVSTTVLLPTAITDEPVRSLNHAFTKLSETFESGRISHTGNIYTRVLYQERNLKWYPLDVLRNKVLAKQEQEIARNLWEEFMAKMNPS
jgi:hypothetical protein